MKFKLILLSIILSTPFPKGICQTQASLNIPPDWTVEKFKLPPSFAPKFPFTGSEEAIFSPEWAKKKTHDYWTYCFRWSLTGHPSLDKTSLENALRIYYSSLVISNLKLANIDTGYAIPVKVKLNKSPAKHSSYTGTIIMLDYMTQDPMTLNIRIKQSDTNVLFFELSPLPFTSKVWIIMDGISR